MSPLLSLCFARCYCSGETSVQKSDGSGALATELKKLKEGDFFGEMALLNEEPRVCDVVANSDKVVTYELNKAAFQRILGSLEDIMKRAVSKRSKQNAKAGGGGSKGTSGTSLRDIPKSQLREVAFLGTGTFGRVTLVQDKKSGETMALKAMSKAQVRSAPNIMLLARAVLMPLLRLLARRRSSRTDNRTTS